MKRYKIILLALIALLIIIISTLISQISVSKSAQAAAVHILFTTLSPTVLATPTPTSNVSSPAGSINSNLLIALIGLSGIIIGALIAGSFSVYQQRRIEQMEKERQKIEQKRIEDQHQHEQSIMRLQKIVDSEISAEEKKKQSEAALEEFRRQKMLLAPTSERTEEYRKALHTDPNISQLQILNMTRPLAVTNVYVRVRVHQGTVSLEMDPLIHTAETQRDPTALLKAGFKHMEWRVSSAIDPDEAIRTYRHCVFVGDPGAGKTTLLKYLTLRAAHGGLRGLPDLPIFVELNAFANSGYDDLLAFTANSWDKRYGFPEIDARVAIEERLKEGSLLLFLDALDETVVGATSETAEASYQRVAKAISHVATRYARSPIVVTARKAGYHQRPKLVGFTELEVLDFRLEDMKQFVTRWFNSYQDARKRMYATELNMRLEQNTRMQALGANPLLLSLIILVFETQLDLPERRAELYKQCVDTLLTEWDATRDIRRFHRFKPGHKRQLLAEIAWHFHSQGRRYFPESEILKIIANFLPRVDLLPEQSTEMLKEIANEQGLLKEQAHGWQGFLHLTLQEYFVAQYVIEHQQLDTLLTHRGDPWWEEVLVLYAGQTNDASLLLHKLLDHDGGQTIEDLFQTDLILSGRCLAAKPAIKDVSLRKIIPERMFEVLMSTPYSLTQSLMADALADIRTKKINDHLLELLSDQQISLSVRGYIAESLGRLGDDFVARELVRLLSDKLIDLSMREHIALSLGRSGGRLAAQLLFDTQVELSIREYIAESLGNSEVHVVIPRLLESLSDQKIELSVRKRIALSLGSIGEYAIIPQLLQLLFSKQIELDIRECIAGTLGTLGDRSVASELLQLLSNTQIERRVRGQLALALGSLGEQSIAPVLLESVVNKQIELDVREKIALALGMLDDTLTTSRLIDMLSDKKINIHLRKSIAEGLGRSGNRTVATELVRMLSNEQIDESVRVSIAETLGKLGNYIVAPELVQLLSNEKVNESVRGSIALALGILGDRSIVPELKLLCSNRLVKASIQARILVALGRLGDRTFSPELAQLLPNKQITASAREHIGRAVSTLEERAPELVQLLFNKHIDLQLRERIAEILSQIGKQSIVEELLQIISNKQVDQDVRGHIAEAIGAIIDDELDLRALAALLPTSDVANYIHRALWSASRRLGVRIFLKDDSGIKEAEVVKW
jgi:HEAT repeat protein